MQEKELIVAIGSAGLWTPKNTLFVATKRNGFLL
jgi:hypothetical protein